MRHADKAQVPARFVSRRNGMVARAPRRRHGGQAMIEFAFAVFILFISIFAAIASSLWAIESMGAVYAEETGLHMAASAQGTGVLSGHNYRVSPTIITKVVEQLKPSMMGTNVVSGPITGDGRCVNTTVAQVANAHNSPTVEVCAEIVPDSTTYWPKGSSIPTYHYDFQPQQVRFYVMGCANVMVPMVPLFCPGGRGVPINNFAASQELVFS